MRLKTAAATAPALLPQTRPLQRRLRAVSGKAVASSSVPSKPMATSPSLHARTAPKAASGSLSAVPQKATRPGVAQPNLAEVGPLRARAAKPNIPQLSAAQQTAKLARRDRVVLEHLPLVKAIAIRVHENLPVHVDVDDLVHSGVLGLFDAASKYNPDKQVAFSSYAKHRIKGAILDSLRQLDWASRDMRRRHKQVEAATRELAADAAAQPHGSRSRAEAGYRSGSLAQHDAGPAQRRSGFSLDAHERGRRSAGAGFPVQARNSSGFHLRPGTTAGRSGRRDEDAAGALSESGFAVLHAAR